MTTVPTSGKERRGPKPRRHHPGWHDELTALARSTSLDTLAAGIPSRIRMVPHSGNQYDASIRIDLPEGTVVRLLVLDKQDNVVQTPVAGWLPAGSHEIRNLALPGGAYKLRLETPHAWHVAGIMMG